MNDAVSFPSLSQAEPALARLRSGFLHALIAGSERQADKVIEQALAARVSANDIYLDIFQPTAYEIGRLWQINSLSVAQEHLATAIIERQMGDLHGFFKSRHDRGRTMVIGCIEKECHRVGAHMVADFFEQDGWTVYYLGASVPTRTFATAARELGAEIVGVSVQMLYYVPTIGDLVRELNGQGLWGVPVIAGGLPLVKHPELGKALGVHVNAGDARSCLALVQQLGL
jgi:MerR family transcriptional regulator, light-induced transcriptional regulator